MNNYQEESLKAYTEPQTRLSCRPTGISTLPQPIKQIRNSWVEDQQSVILQVPSAIVPTESNYLINPSHPDFTKLKIAELAKFEFDLRLMKSYLMKVCHAEDK